MIIGNPDKFAFLIEIIPEWEDDYFKNGIMFVSVNGEIYPKEVRTTTFNSELPDILGEHSPFINPVSDSELYNHCQPELTKCLADITFPQNIEYDNDYRFLIPFHEINDSGYSFFIISNDRSIKIIVSKWVNDNIEFIDETEISIPNYDKIKSQILAFYNKGKF